MRVVINPYGIIRNPEDVRVLKEIFGSENVFDFTGINPYTGDIHNYSERTHYRPILGARIMKRFIRSFT